MKLRKNKSNLSYEVRFNDSPLSQSQTMHGMSAPPAVSTPLNRGIDDTGLKASAAHPANRMGLCKIVQEFRFNPPPCGS